jgi:hypothetical protein
VHLRNRARMIPRLCDESQPAGKNGSGAGTKGIAAPSRPRLRIYEKIPDSGTSSGGDFEFWN